MYNGHNGRIHIPSCSWKLRQVSRKRKEIFTQEFRFNIIQVLFPVSYVGIYRNHQHWAKSKRDRS